MWELLVKFENESDVFSSEKFAIAHSSTMNPCEYGVVVLKWQVFKDKHPLPEKCLNMDQ